MKIVGYKITSFVTKDGTKISGITFYVEYKEENNKIYGLCTDKIFLSDNRINGQSFAVGDKINPVYNRYGKVEKVTFSK